MTSLEPEEPTELDELPYVSAPPATFDALPGRPRRKRFGRLTYTLCALLIGAAAFYAGARTERSTVTASSTGGAASSSTGGAASSGALAAGRNIPAGFGPGAGAGGAPSSVATSGGSPGGGGLGGSATTGTVKVVDGSFVYVQQSDGTIVKASVTPASAISLSTTGTIAQLHPGDNVTISGAAGADGTIKATSVRDQGASGTNPISTGSTSASASASAGAGGGGGGPPGG